ncbi:hypothetical protein Nepgr_002916 [Nepenthes gracilis]|uniref:Homeobox domain-containing protein n=1 Tax=Nepenthes gracilis TaxID=150966 RepID=A0AAD3P7Z3_NEPGR|nr:hypothetical protein Nepgr_002916 [Nepenthes gracilis]
MWMLGCKEGGHELSVLDSFNGRKLRPLIPRPSVSSSGPANATTSCLGCNHGSEIFTLNHPLVATAAVEEQTKNDQLNTAGVTGVQPVVSSRWNPTPEQLRMLEELYRRGTRTPSAEQIQHITIQLRRYGKIEGKNVFYWFQNHKARERQKRRRELDLATHHHHHDNIERKDRAGPISRTGFEAEQTKNWEASTNCSAPPAEESGVSIQRAEKAAAVSGVGTDIGWIQFDERERELQQYRRSFAGERNATWQTMHLSSSPYASSSYPATAGSTITTGLINTAAAAKPALAIESLSTTTTCIVNETSQALSIDKEERCDDASRTLQLFPLRSDEDNDDDDEKDGEMKFFEFLPLNN